MNPSDASHKHSKSNTSPPSPIQDVQHVTRKDATVLGLSTGNRLHSEMALDVDRMHASVVGQRGAKSLRRKAAYQVRPSDSEAGVDQAQTFDERGHLHVVTRVDQDRHPGDGREGNSGHLAVEQPVSNMRSRPLGRAQRRTLVMLKEYFLSMLSIFIPIVYYVPIMNDEGTIVLTLLAIAPLTKLFSFATKMLYVRLGMSNARLVTFLKSVILQMIVQTYSVINCQLDLAQSALVGSILSDLLLIPGLCLFVGGIRFSEDGLSTSITLPDRTRLTLILISILLPATFYNAIPSTTEPLAPSKERYGILALSRSISVILLFILVFSTLISRLFSHKNSKSSSGKGHYTSNSPPPTSDAIDLESSQRDTGSVEAGLHEMEEPQISVTLTTAMTLYIVVCMITLPSFIATALNTIDNLNSKFGTLFASTILSPIMGNIIEDGKLINAIMGSLEKKNEAIQDAVDSVIGTVLFVTPFTVILSWSMGKPMTLFFDPLVTSVLFLSVLAGNHVARNGRSNWLEGMILICFYVMSAVIFWFFPGSDPVGVLASCQ